MRPGRVLFGGLAALYLLAYLRGTTLLVTLLVGIVWLLWRVRRAGGHTPSGRTGGWPGRVVYDSRTATAPQAAEVAEVVDPDGTWSTAPTVVYGVPQPLAAARPAGFAALVELRDHAGRQAMLQVEAAHPADIDLDRLVRQALTQAARRAGWQVQRWQPVTDDVFAPVWDQAEGWTR